MFRSRYPELTAGAVASSAPLNFKLDFYGESSNKRVIHSHFYLLQTVKHTDKF